MAADTPRRPCCFHPVSPKTLPVPGQRWHCQILSTHREKRPMLMFSEPHHPVANASTDPLAVTVGGHYHHLQGVQDASDEGAGDGNHLSTASISSSLPHLHLPPPLPTTQTTSTRLHNGYPHYTRSHPLPPSTPIPSMHPIIHLQTTITH